MGIYFLSFFFIFTSFSLFFCFFLIFIKRSSSDVFYFAVWCDDGIFDVTDIIPVIIPFTLVSDFIDGIPLSSMESDIFPYILTFEKVHALLFIRIIDSV